MITSGEEEITGIQRVEARIAAKEIIRTAPHNRELNASCTQGKGTTLQKEALNLLLSVNHSVMSNSLGPHALYSPRLLSPWTSPGKDVGVGSHSLLQGIFMTQGLNLVLLHCRQILYQVSHQGSP